MITRSGILREVLEEKGRELMKYSKNGGGLIPLPGYEQVFEDRSEECRMLRQMIMESYNREQQATAQWQKDLMDGKQPDMSWEMTGGERDGGKKYAGLTAEQKKAEQNEEGQDQIVDVLVTNKSGVYLNGRKILPQPVTYPGGE